MDERLTLVETKIAYLEDMVMTLNELVIRQQKEIDLLHSSKERLETRIAELAGMESDIPQRKPPHY